MYASIGEYIKILRNRQGITQQQLADLSNLSLMSIRRYENNDRIPTIKVLQELANALHISIGDLLKYGESYSQLSNESIVSKVKDPKAREFEAMLNYEELALLNYFRILNDTGKQRAIVQIEDLTKIEEYKEAQSKVE